MTIFSPTHEVTLREHVDGPLWVVPVQLASGLAYARLGGRIADTGWWRDDLQRWSLPKGASVRKIVRGPATGAWGAMRPMSIRATERDRGRWEQAAEKTGLGAQAWIRKTLNAAAGVLLGGAQGRST